MRAAVYADSYSQACDLNQAITGKRISKQTWNICLKIRQVDTALPAAVPVVETHPEVLFAALNGGTPLVTKKKERAGQAQRLALLRSHMSGVDETYQGALASIPRSQATRDDLIDAMVCAASSYLCARCGTASLPGNPPLDQRDLPMQIVYPRILS